MAESHGPEPVGEVSEPASVATDGSPRRTELGRDGVLLFASDLATIVAGVVIAAVLTRVLAEVGYGRWTYLLALFTTLLLVVDLGVPTLLGRSVAQAPGQARRWLRSSALLQLGSAAVAVPLVIVVAVMRVADGDAAWTWTAVLLGGATGAQFLSHSHRHLLRALGEARLEAVSRLMDRSLVAVAIAGLAIAGETDVLRYAIGAAVGPLAATVWLVFHGSRIARQRDAQAAAEGQPDGEAPPPSAELLRAGLPFMIIMGLSPLLANLDKFLLEAFIGLAAVGVYNVAWIVHRAGLVAPLALRQILLPWLGAARGDALATRQRVAQALNLALWLLPVGLIVGSAVALLAIPLVFEPIYDEAVGLFLILLGGWALTLLASPFIGVLQSSRSGWVAAAPVASALVGNLVAGVLLIPLVGLTGAAWATVFAQGVFLVSALVMSRPSEVLEAGALRTLLVSAGLAVVATSVATWGLLTEQLWIGLGLALLVVTALAVIGRWRPTPPLRTPPPLPVASDEAA